MKFNDEKQKDHVRLTEDGLYVHVTEDGLVMFKRFDTGRGMETVLVMSGEAFAKAAAHVGGTQPAAARKGKK